MPKYPNLSFNKTAKPKRTPRRKRGRQGEAPRATPAVNPLASIDGDLQELKEAIQASTRQLRVTARPDIGTDGKTEITPEMKRRGEIVEIVGTMKMMRDPVTGTEWVERIM